jgi:hypothetical protein
MSELSAVHRVDAVDNARPPSDTEDGPKDGLRALPPAGVRPPDRMARE